MYSHSELQQEITDKIDGLIAQKESVLHPDWITQAIALDHPDIHGKDAEFWKYTGWQTLRGEIRQSLNRFKVKAQQDPTQLTLEGFEQLQCYYLVTRGRDQLAVAVNQLTDAELDTKAREYEKMGHACLKHADEIRRYKEQRKESQAS